ncbi:carboxymuconolactone decarboxylase family protein [Muricauda sp. 334s03]|uniref:Carboxymuconolactone decarboxylase family protein n=1 Tax=Flagellimonas yonaguniensis TaxID=3031325 RepID=A0ABT5XYT5_9FLAO|nr:carboxymuconolactone decarboxylase family protein [[Muricauda] yonaguniensis]MDF0716279.1 carboxymuconolactone decarboxylase family protein [[Muricauda] yonaguniensis]
MEKRIQIDATEPNAFKAMFGLEKYIQEGQLDKIHYELIKIRASQLNGCSFCINMHTTDALALGENPKRLFLLDAWWDTDLFTDEERVILKATEEVTMVHKNGLSQETYEKALTLFDEHYFSQIIMAIVTINAWNRIAISTHKPLQD